MRGVTFDFVCLQTCRNSEPPLAPLATMVPVDGTQAESAGSSQAQSEKTLSGRVLSSVGMQERSAESALQREI